MTQPVELKSPLAGEIVGILCNVWEHGPEGIANDIVDYICRQLGLEAPSE